MYAGEGGGSAKGIVIFVIIVVCAVVILAMAYAVYRKRAASKSRDATTAPSVTMNHEESEVI
jgi:flagellar basal body-associated protein FliL